MNENDVLHLIPVGNKVYHAEKYIMQTEHDKMVIADAVRHIEAYFEQNKKEIEWSELGKRGMRLKDALYFLNKIKECVKE